MTSPILPGATLGVLGNGQLGRMFALAARRMGYRIVAFGPGEDSPAGQVADQEVVAPYDDLDAIRRFAAMVSVVTFEFENVPSASAAAAAALAPTRPDGSLLHTTQQRRREKNALTAAGVPVARFAVVDSEESLAQAVQEVGTPAILKTVAWGYDGKGQVRINDAASASAAWDTVGRNPCVLEAVVPFEREVSVLGVRGTDGSIALYDAVENVHANHILDVSVSPASISKRSAEQAREITRTLLEAWDVVGVICVEMFQLANGDLMVNEVAPRPHNSGHLTIEGHATSQFEQQVRAICGLPLGSTERVAPAAMVNLLGDLWMPGEPNWAKCLGTTGVALHLYGKSEARPGRKMGHVTALAESAAEASALVRRAREVVAGVGEAAGSRP